MLVKETNKTEAKREQVSEDASFTTRWGGAEVKLPMYLSLLPVLSVL